MCSGGVSWCGLVNIYRCLKGAYCLHSENESTILFIKFGNCLPNSIFQSLATLRLERQNLGKSSITVRYSLFYFLPYFFSPPICLSYAGRCDDIYMSRPSVDLTPSLRLRVSCRWKYVHIEDVWRFNYLKNKINLHDFMLPPRNSWELQYSQLLCSE